MQREPKTYRDYYIGNFYPLLFWKACEKCNKEFRREDIWQVLSFPPRWGIATYNHNLGTYHYFCKHCFPTIESIDELCKGKIGRKIK